MVRLSRNNSVSVGTSIVQVSEATRRSSFSIMNTGATTVYIYLSDTEGAATGSGIVLLPNAALTDSNGGDYKCWQGRISALSSGAGGTLAVFENLSGE